MAGRDVFRFDEQGFLSPLPGLERARAEALHQYAEDLHQYMDWLVGEVVSAEDRRNG